MLPTAVKIIINIIIAAIALRLCFVKDDYSGERKFLFGLFMVFLITVWVISKTMWDPESINWDACSDMLLYNVS